jgi:hypothetical protein
MLFVKLLTNFKFKLENIHCLVSFSRTRDRGSRFNCHIFWISWTAWEPGECSRYSEHTPGCRTVQSFYSCRGSRFFSFPKPRPALGPIHLPTERVPRAAYPGVKWWKRDANHSPPSSAEIKNEWRHTATLHYVVMAHTGTNLAQPSVDYTNTYIHRHIHIKYIDTYTYIHTHTHTPVCVCVWVHVC